MTYAFHTQFDSPNHNPGVIRLPARRVVLHWWGSPSGQDPYGVIRWLCTPASQVSAHAVIWPGNVACLVPYTARSWANGNDEANSTSITLECDPNNVVDTMPTIIEYLADLVRQNVLTADFKLSGHKDWYATACPGAYYDWLPTIRRRVTEALTSTISAPATPKPEPKPKPEPTIEEIIAMNSGITWTEGKTHHYLLFNTFSGWMQEYNNGGGGPLSGNYNNPIAAALRTGSFATVSASHARAIKRSLADLRAGKVEVSGTVTIEGADQ